MGAETSQVDYTVAVTLNEAVEVAASAGLAARFKARKPNANANREFLMGYSLLLLKCSPR